MVQGIVDVPRPIPRRGRQFDVLMEWTGTDYFPRQPYAPSWVSVTALRPELAMEARAMELAMEMGPRQWNMLPRWGLVSNIGAMCARERIRDGGGEAERA